MKFNLIFDITNDVIPFEVKYNHDLIEWFILHADQTDNNKFSDDNVVYSSCDRLLTQLHWSLSKTNEVLWPLYESNFSQCENLTDYLDQRFLNRQHELWVKSQYHEIDIDCLCVSENRDKNKFGNLLHEIYPDEIRKIKLAEAITKLGYIYHYEEVNMTVHRLEDFFNKDIEYKADRKWQVFDNPFVKKLESNNSRVNFSFGYTYVGRQYYDKWKNYDTNLEFSDHYNYETLEWAFQVNLGRPETVAYSPEFVKWCRQQGVPELTTQLPIANIIDLERNLHYYRTMLYKNSKQKNKAKLKII